MIDDPGAARISVDVVPVRCGCWACEGCGRRLCLLHRQLVEAGFGDHAARGDPLARFLTVTFPTDAGALLNNREDCANTSALFARLIQEIRRTHSPRIEYYVVKEPTKRGRLHLHAITFGPYLRKCRYNLPGECVLGCGADCRNPCHRPRGCQATGGLPCVQAIAHRLGLGWVDIKLVEGNGVGAGRYIAKYLNKHHVGHRWPRYSRRVSYSRRFAPTTIGQLDQKWSAEAYRRGVEQGFIIPDAFPAAEHTRWRLLSELIRRGPPVVDLRPPRSRVDWDTGEIIDRPSIALDEVAVIRRHNRRIAEAMAELGDSPDLDPQTRRLIAAAAARQIG